LWDACVVVAVAVSLLRALVTVCDRMQARDKVGGEVQLGCRSGLVSPVFA
jgi:hypothetical protein